jgi:ribosomal protein S3AE
MQKTIAINARSTHRRKWRSEFLPYIKPENRKKYDKVLKELVTMLKTLPAEEVDGELNYIITKTLKEIYPLRYFHINKAIGVLECAKLEFYRRVAAPYEDIKIKESGDV